MKVLGQASATPLDKATPTNKMPSSCLKNKFDNSAHENATGLRRDGRAVSFSFRQESWRRSVNDDDHDQRDPPNEEARHRQEFWDDTEYSVSMDSAIDRKKADWSPSERHLCNKMLCGGGNLDTEIYNEGPLKDLELEPLGDYQALFFKEDDDDYSLSAKSGSMPTRKVGLANELSATLSEDTDISLNANSMHQFDSDLIDSMDIDSCSSSSRSLGKAQSRDEGTFRFPHSLLRRQVNADTSTGNKRSITRDPASQVDCAVQNFQADTSHLQDSSLEKPVQSMQEDTIQSKNISSLHKTHQNILQEDSAQSTLGSPLHVSVSTETLECERGEETHGVEWTLHEFRESTKSKLSGFRLVPTPKPRQEQPASNPTDPQDGSRPSSRAKSVTMKLMSFRRSTSKPHEDDRLQAEKMQSSSPETPPSAQHFGPAQDVTSPNRLGQNRERQVSEKPLDTETQRKESVSTATPSFEPGCDRTEKARQEIPDDIESEDEIERSSPIGFIHAMTETMDDASEQEESGKYWSPPSVCCTLMPTPAVDRDDLSEANVVCQEDHEREPSKLQQSCEDDDDDEQESSDPGQSLHDEEDDNNILTSGSAPFLSGLCCFSESHKEEGNILDYPSPSSQSSVTVMPPAISCEEQETVAMRPSAIDCEKQQDERAHEENVLNNADTMASSSVSEEQIAGCFNWNMPILGPIMASMIPATSGNLPSSHDQGDQRDSMMQKLVPVYDTQVLQNEPDDCGSAERALNPPTMSMQTEDDCEQEGDQQGDMMQWLSHVSDKGCVRDERIENDCDPTECKFDPPGSPIPTEEDRNLPEGSQEGDQEGEMMQLLSCVSDKGCVPTVNNDKDCGSTDMTLNHPTSSMPVEDDCDFSERHQEGDHRRGMMRWLSHVSVKGCVSDIQTQKDGAVEGTSTENNCDSSEPQEEEAAQDGVSQCLKNLNLQACNPLSDERDDSGCAEWTTQGLAPIIFFLPTASGGSSNLSEPQHCSPSVLESECIGQEPTVVSPHTIDNDRQSQVSAKSPRSAFLPTLRPKKSTKPPLVSSSDSNEMADEKRLGADPIESAGKEDEEAIKARDEITRHSQSSRRGSIAKMSRRKMAQHGEDVTRRVRSLVNLFDRAQLKRQNHVLGITQSPKKAVNPRVWKANKQQKQQTQPRHVSDKSLGIDMPSTTPTAMTLASCSEPAEISHATSADDVEPALDETSLLTSLTGWSLPDMFGQESTEHEPKENGNRVKELVQMFDRYYLTTPPLHRGDYILEVKSVDHHGADQQPQDQDNQETARDMTPDGSQSSTIRKAKSEDQESHASDAMVSMASWFGPNTDLWTHQEEEHENEEKDEPVHPWDNVAALASSFSSVQAEVAGSSIPLTQDAPPLPKSGMMINEGEGSTAAQAEPQDESNLFTCAYESLCDSMTSTTSSFGQWWAESKRKEEAEEMDDQVRSNDSEPTPTLAISQPAFSGGYYQELIISRVSTEPRKRKRRSVSMSDAYDTLRDLVTSALPSFDRSMPQSKPKVEEEAGEAEAQDMEDQGRILQLLGSTPQETAQPETPSPSKRATPAEGPLPVSNESHSAKRKRRSADRILRVVGSRRRLFGRKKKQHQHQQQVFGS